MLGKSRRAPDPAPPPPPQFTAWLALITTLPTHDPTTCMKVLRSLDSMGAALLREGAYVLPEAMLNTMGMQRLEMLICSAGGSAYVIGFRSRDAAQETLLRKLFDRSARYEELLRTLQGLRVGFGVSDPGAIARVVKRQAQAVGALASVDFFPGPIKGKVEAMLATLEQEVRALMFPDNPAVAPRERTRAAFLAKVWVSRQPLFSDRLASAWLIRRFIDPEASIRFLDTSEGVPHAAVTFGFDRAQFTASKDRLTYEELLRFFRLTSDAALQRIGQVIRSIELGDRRSPEAPSVEVMLTGARNRAANHHELFAETEKLFDLLYDQYFAPTPARAKATAP